MCIRDSHWRGRVGADTEFGDTDRADVDLVYQVKARYLDTGDSDWVTCSHG